MNSLEIFLIYFSIYGLPLLALTPSFKIVRWFRPIFDIDDVLMKIVPIPLIYIISLGVNTLTFFAILFLKTWLFYVLYTIYAITFGILSATLFGIFDGANRTKLLLCIVAVGVPILILLLSPYNITMLTMSLCALNSITFTTTWSLNTWRAFTRFTRGLDSSVVETLSKLKQILETKGNANVVKLLTKEFMKYIDNVRKVVWYVNDKSLRNLELVHNLLRDVGVAFAVTRNGDLHLLIRDADGIGDYDCYVVYSINVLQKMEKPTGKLYHVVLTSLLLVGNRYGSSLTLSIQNMLITVDNMGRKDVLYCRFEDVDKSIRYLDLYTMGVVNNYEQYLKLKDRLDLHEL